jgi:hypothetical protein
MKSRSSLGNLNLDRAIFISMLRRFRKRWPSVGWQNVVRIKLHATMLQPLTRGGNGDVAIATNIVVPRRS